MADRLGAVVVDVTQVLIEAMRAQAAEVGLPWDMVQAADAAPEGSRDAAGLDALVQRSLPAIEAAVNAAVSDAPRELARFCSPNSPRWPGTGTWPCSARGRTWPPAARKRSGRSCPAFRHPGRCSQQAPTAARRSRPVLPPRRRVDRFPAPRVCRRRSIVTATTALTTDLQQQVLLLEDDLRARLQADAEREGQWKQEHQRARDKERTAASWVAWRDDRITQAAVAWVSAGCSSGSVRTTRSSRRCGSPGRSTGGRKPWTPSSPTSGPTPSTPTASGSSRRSTTSPGCPLPSAGRVALGTVSGVTVR